MNTKGNGYLQTKIRNDRLRKRKLADEFEDEIETVHVETNEDENIPDENIEKDLRDLLNATLPAQIDYAKIKLKKTLNYRRQRDLNESIKIKENYPGFFVCPELISFDFYLTWSRRSKSLDALWSPFGQYVFTIVKNSGKNILQTEGDTDLGELI